jgi:hypothetical protein
MGMRGHGVLWVIISDLSQVEKVAETAKEEKAFVIITVLNFICTSSFLLICSIIILYP